MNSSSEVWAYSSSTQGQVLSVLFMENQSLLSEIVITTESPSTLTYDDLMRLVTFYMDSRQRIGE